MTKFVGIHVIVECPRRGSYDKDLAVKCQKASAKRTHRGDDDDNEDMDGPVIDVTTDDILYYIPVTRKYTSSLHDKKDVVTYANAYCALCHGVEEFEYWNVEIQDLSACFVRAIREATESSSTMTTTTRSFVAIANESKLRYDNCSFTGRVVPFARSQMMTQLWDHYLLTAPSRLTQFCLNRAILLACPNHEIQIETLSEEVKPIGKCVDGEKTKIGICNGGRNTLVKCDICSENQRCFEKFDQRLLYSTYAGSR